MQSRGAMVTVSSWPPTVGARSHPSRRVRARGATHGRRGLSVMPDIDAFYARASMSASEHRQDSCPVVAVAAFAGGAISMTHERQSRLERVVELRAEQLDQRVAKLQRHDS